MLLLPLLPWLLLPFGVAIMGFRRYIECVAIMHNMSSIHNASAAINFDNKLVKVFIQI